MLQALLLFYLAVSMFSGCDLSASLYPEGIVVRELQCITETGGADGQVISFVIGNSSGNVYPSLELEVLLQSEAGGSPFASTSKNFMLLDNAPPAPGESRHRYYCVPQEGTVYVAVRLLSINGFPAQAQ